jgi:hypothetical protein
MQWRREVCMLLIEQGRNRQEETCRWKDIQISIQLSMVHWSYWGNKVVTNSSALKMFIHFVSSLTNNIVDFDTWVLGFECRGSKGFFSPPKVRIGSGAHLSSYSIGTDGSFPSISRPWREADHSPSTSTKVTHNWDYISAYPIWLHGM